MTNVVKVIGALGLKMMNHLCSMKKIMVTCYHQLAVLSLFPRARDGLV